MAVSLPLVFTAPRRGMPPKHLADLDSAERLVREHGSISEAVAAGDAAEASRRMEAHIAKVEQVRSVGIRTSQLLWDDIEHTLNCPEDEALYGHEERPSAAAQAPFTNHSSS